MALGGRFAERGRDLTKTEEWMPEEAVIARFENELAGNFSTDSPLFVFPNPTRDLLNIVFSENENSVVELTVVNAFGQVVLRHQETAVSGNNQLTINLMSLPAGHFSVILQTREKRSVAGLVIVP